MSIEQSPPIFHGTRDVVVSSDLYAIKSELANWSFF